jgi:hypothetical protein
MKIQRISKYFTKFFKNAKIFNSYKNFSTFKPPHNFTNIKINNKNEKFPTEDENIANLINELMTPKSENESNISTMQNYVIQKDDVVFISNFSNHKILSKIKLGEFIEIDGKFFAQCITIKENLLIFIQLQKHK